MDTYEINRMKQLMGLKTSKSFVSENYKKEIKNRLIIEALTGGKDELYKWIAKASGLSDETAEAFSKEASTFMKGSDEFAQVLAREGLDDVGKIQQKLSNAGYDITDLDKAITMYFKQNPNVAKEVLKSMPEFTDNIIKNMSLETILSKQPDLVDVLKFVSSSEFKLETEDMVDDYQKLMTDIQKLADASGGNQSIHNVLNLMDIKLDVHDATKNLGTGSSTKQTPTVQPKQVPTTPKQAPTTTPKSKTQDYDFLNDTEKNNIDILLSTEVSSRNVDYLRDELNAEITKLKNTKESDYPGDKTKIDELINILRQKEKEAINLKMKESGGNYVVNPNKKIVKGSQTDGGVEENVKLPDWMWGWWRGDDPDFYKGSKVNDELKEKVAKLNTYTFKPEDVKVTNKGVDSDGRDIFELLLPSGDKILVYRSTGTGASALKGYGDWQVINGFGRHPKDSDFFWVVKTADSTQYTKNTDLSEYLTNMANYLKSNNGTPETLLGKPSVTNQTPKTNNQDFEKMQIIGQPNKPTQVTQQTVTPPKQPESPYSRYGAGSN